MMWIQALDNQINVILDKIVCLPNWLMPLKKGLLNSSYLYIQTAIFFFIILGWIFYDHNNNCNLFFIIWLFILIIDTLQDLNKPVAMQFHRCFYIFNIIITIFKLGL